MLTFGLHNSKLIELADFLGVAHNAVVSFDLPAGYTCPAANECRAFAHRKTGRMIDSKGMKFRCYAASSEGRFPSSRRAHWRNFDLLREKHTTGKMARLIEKSLPKSAKYVRIHSSGDYYSYEYFMAWVAVAARNPDIIFFGYSKIIDYVRFAHNLGADNFKIVYSFGGKEDYLAADTDPICYVVTSKAQAKKLGVKLACEKDGSGDFDYIMRGESFALLVHGNQPAGFYKKK